MKNATKIFNIQFLRKRVPCINVTPLIQNNVFCLSASAPPQPTDGGLIYLFLCEVVACFL